MTIGKNHYYKIAILSIILLFTAAASVIFFPTVLSLTAQRNKLLHVVLKIRLPQVLIALTAGSCLGLAGALMQIILGNSLASPFTLGISSAAAFGASVAIALGIQEFGSAQVLPHLFLRSRRFYYCCLFFRWQEFRSAISFSSGWRSISFLRQQILCSNIMHRPMPSIRSLFGV